MEENKTRGIGILLASLYLILVSIVFIIRQLVVAIKMDWTFSDFHSTLIIVKWFVYIIAGVVFFIGGIDLLRRKLRGWWIGNAYFSLLTIISIYVIYESSKALANYGGKNELLPAFVAIVLGWLNCLMLMTVWPRIKSGSTKKTIFPVIALLIFSGLILVILSLLLGFSQLEKIAWHDHSGEKDSTPILLLIFRVLIIIGSVGVIVLGSVEIVKKRLGLFRFGILASALIFLGGISVLSIGLRVLEKNLGFFVDWAQILLSVMGFTISSFLFIYLFKRKNHFFKS